MRSSRIADAELVSLEPSTCAVASSSSRVYVAYVRTRVHNAREHNGPRSRNISPPPAHRRPKCIHPIIFASPCLPARLSSRAATFSPFTLYLRRRICMECIHMKSTILPPTFPLAVFSFSLSLSRSISLVSPPRSTSASSLCSVVNPTEDTRNVTCVVENWFVHNDVALLISMRRNDMI